MARRLRIEFNGAIYHVTARCSGRRNIVRHGDERHRLLLFLERAVVRSG